MAGSNPGMNIGLMTVVKRRWSNFWLCHIDTAILCLCCVLVLWRDHFRTKTDIS